MHNTFSRIKSVALVAMMLAIMPTISIRAGEQEGRITAEQAMNIALAQAGGGDIVELDRSYGRGGIYFYRVEVVNNTGAYHIQIDESTGGLLKFIKKGGGQRYVATVPAAPPTAPAPGTGVVITREQALAIALSHTNGGTVVESDTDRKRDGRVVYEFEIVNNGTKYDIDIDGGGNVIKSKQKHGYSYITPVPDTVAAAAPVQQFAYPQPRLSAEAAQDLAKEKAGGGAVTGYELDYDDGRLVHEITIANGARRYLLPCYIGLGYPAENAPVLEQVACTVQEKTHFGKW